MATTATRRFKPVFFCPIDSTQKILQHLSAAFPSLLGNIGGYQQCAFISRGTGKHRGSLASFQVSKRRSGQFMPKAAANPTVGSADILERVEEDRVEIVVYDSGLGSRRLEDAITELKKIHPYEEVAYDVYGLEDF